MKYLYYSLALSTLSSIKESPNPFGWQFLSLLVFSTNLTLNILTIWLIIDTYLLPNFSSFLNLTGEFTLLSLLLNITFYIFGPFFIINYYLLFFKKRYISLMAANKKIISKNIFKYHFFASYSFAYLALISCI